MKTIQSFFRKINNYICSRDFLRRRQKAERGFGIAVNVLVSILFVFLFTGVICVLAFGFYVNKYLAKNASLDVASINMNYTTVVYYTDGETGEQKELERLYGSENRVWVSSYEIPKNLKNAFIAIEDERFMSHKGVDWKRTMAAVVNLVLPYSGNFGGSTITQQLIKNITGDDEVTVQRKVLEILRAFDLERKLSKDEILEMYLNTINLSQGCYGVSSAAYVYFGKTVDQLDLAECAAIAGITNSPTYYDPFQNPDNNKARQELILDKMVSLGMISREECDEAIDEVLEFRNINDDEKENSSVQSYFTDLLITEVISDIKEKLGYSTTMAYKLLYAGGLKIEATINPEIQSALEEYYENRDNFPRVSGTTQLESAMVIMSTDGKLLGIVGGIGHKSGNLILNRALAQRQPGSVIKPVSVYAPAIEYGLITPYSVLDDSPTKYISTSGALVEGESVILLHDSSIKAWPSNSDNTYSGLMTVRRAVAESTNTVAVRVLDMVGLDTAYEFATERFGLGLVRDQITDGVFASDVTYSGLALGGLSYGVSLMEITASYVPFSNGGVYTKPTTYTRIYDAEGNLLIDNSAGDSIACSVETSYYIRDMLQEAVTDGTGIKASLDGFSVAGKTGTTSSNYDRWFVGFSPYFVAGVWVGFDTNKTVNVAGNPSVDIWHDVMTKVHQGYEPKQFEKPEGLVSCSFCLDSGGIPGECCSKDERGDRIAYGEFFVDDIPTTICSNHVEVKLCSSTNKICTEFCNHNKATSVIRLNLYRYFAVPNIMIADEGWCVHFDGAVSDRIKTHYYPAASKSGKALEGSCYLHTAPVTVSSSETTTDEYYETTPPVNTPHVQTIITETTLTEPSETDETSGISGEETTDIYTEESSDQTVESDLPLPEPPAE